MHVPACQAIIHLEKFVGRIYERGWVRSGGGIGGLEGVDRKGYSFR